MCWDHDCTCHEFQSPSGDDHLSDKRALLFALRQRRSLFQSPSGDDRLSDVGRVVRALLAPYDPFQSPSGDDRLSDFLTR